jgi:hypothetical protein
MSSTINFRSFNRVAYAACEWFDSIKYRAERRGAATLIQTAKQHHRIHRGACAARLPVSLQAGN